MIYLSTVTHDIKSNTLEAIWLEEVLDVDGNLVELKRSKGGPADRPVKSRNYSSEQKAEFDADTGTTKYSELAGW
ncbi:hypothetical protein UFOVP1470_28 [uncultured Caudovirales phage]|uniref:Uncharacterized protein n=1 Tax=uncultured Caudovirales phage TaxID=2100421 RepID=A0A6J5PTN6_9CAUD|nr:hypothetical protein UFOVP939_51 [uncultured Caudovirales phage]CAB4178570.1 hypothetical protein UFOVP1018_26 [uncultured Caudovirales phage]CAB4184054.1 hypothetical protein UFOVP1105_27 [uncultured Caudovirales phage]CAB4202493.1 hypothetical protein UFOVP1372_17 [uncultured Caudovirales phage]CAB4215021.1 hypothetical protein UFOVP1470_28 [uncultured Caudovirales phage]